jgi:ATP-dependent helicase HrpA
VNLYPTLRCEDERVALRLLDSREDAVRESVVGVRKLAQHALAREVQDLKKQAKEVDTFKQLLVLYCNPEQMKEHVVQAALNRLFEGELRYPLRERDFVELIATAKSRMPNLVSSIVGTVKTCLQLRRSLLDVKRPYPTMREDLDRILPVNFAALIPYEHLQHLPRYLKGMVIRCDRADNDPQRYHQRVQQLIPYEKLVREQSSTIPPSFRWMVEEFKISLFAQELGTTYPVSATRLDKWLAAHKE